MAQFHFVSRGHRRDGVNAAAAALLARAGVTLLTRPDKLYSKCISGSKVRGDRQHSTTVSGVAAAA